MAAFATHRAATASPNFAGMQMRGSPQSARTSSRRTKANDQFHSLELSVDRELLRLEQFRDSSLAQIRSQSQKLIQEIRTSSEKIEREFNRKCEELKVFLSSKLAQAGDSKAGFTELKGLMESAQGAVYNLAFSLHVPRVNLQEGVRWTLECKGPTEPVRPNLDQDLTSPDYRRLKPLANYLERNAATIKRPIEDLFVRTLRGEVCRVISLPDPLLDQDVEHLCTLLSSSLGIKELSLDGKGIGPNGGLLLSKALPSLSTLTSLNLRSNDLCDEGIRCISACFPKLPRLTQLYLSSNNIGTEGSMHLARNLNALRGLKELSISANPIGCKGMVFLCDSLTELKELVAINLASCSIGHEGAFALLTIISRLPKLRKLWIGNNELGDEGRKLLGKLPTLRVFH